MANKGIAAFDEFTAGVLSKLTDPEARRKAEEAIGTLKQIAPVVQALGDGIAGQAEIDRNLQTLTAQREELDSRKAELDDRDTRLATWHGELTTWYAENKSLVEEAKKIKKPNGKENPNPDSKGLEGLLTEDGFNERIQTERAGFLGFSRDQNLLTRDHFAKFGEIVDLEPLLKHPQIGTIGLIGVYEQVHKDRLDKWKTDKTVAHDKEVADAAVKTFQESQASMPYPSPTGAGSGSPLDALSVGKPDALVDRATAEYNRLVRERESGVTTAR